MAASDVCNFFIPIVKNVCPAWVKSPMPMIQNKSIILGVTQLRNTNGDNVTREIKGKYLIIIKTSSVNDNFFTVMYASAVDIAPRNATNTVKLSKLWVAAIWI